MATFDPTRLYSTLLNTGLQVKDNALYQVIHDLIAALATVNKQTNTLAASSSTPATVTNIVQQLTEITDFGFEDFQIPNINSSVTNVVNNVNNTIQQISDSSSDSNFVDDFQIPGPIGPPGPVVPYHIGINETFFVPLYKQALFAMNIDNEGIIEVEGFLIEVDGFSIGTWTPSIGGSGGDTGITYSAQNGQYVKVGKLVHYQADIVLSNKGTITGATILKGLPFMTSASNPSAPGFVGFWSGMTTAFCFMAIVLDINATTGTFYGAPTAAVAALSGIGGPDLSNTSRWVIAGTYISN